MFDMLKRMKSGLVELNASNNEEMDEAAE
jgi:hypothetical protein